jgi:predicted PurR-regulated permease PerM
MNRSYLLPYLGVLLVLAAACWLLVLLRSVAIPLLLALLLAYCFDPAVRWLEHRRLPRWAAVLLVFVLLTLVLAGFASFLVPAVHGELRAIQQALPAYAQGLYQALPATLLERLGIAGQGDLQPLLGKLLAGVKNLSFDVVNQVAVFVSHAFSTTIGFLIAVLGYLIIPVYLYYLLVDFDRFHQGLLGLVPWRFREGLRQLGREVDGVLGAFLRGQLSVCLILALLYSIGLLVIGIDLALVIGILAGLAFIVPYVGTIFGIVVGGAMAVAKFHDLLHPLLVVGWFALVQGLEGMVITPRVVGDRVGLHPMATILAVLTGGELFGFLGLLLAVPAAAAANVLLRHLLQAYRSSPFFLADGGGAAPDA